MVETVVRYYAAGRATVDDGGIVHRTAIVIGKAKAKMSSDGASHGAGGGRP
jgi:hypothetical protein